MGVAEPSRHVILVAIALYAGCSSSLLVINKVAMHVLPNASLVLLMQFCTSVSIVRTMKFACPEIDVEPIHWEKAKLFIVATVVFYMCLLSNTSALASVNIETVIVVRSCVPIAVAVLEHLTLGRNLPSVRGILALFGIAGGAVLYVTSDVGFQIQGYAWLTVYFFFIVVEMVFIKFVIDTVAMSTWTRVYYNNALSIPMALFSMCISRDDGVFELTLTPVAISAIILSCVVGFSISYAGFNLRKLVSATTFTVIGVCCKILTVLVNDIIWTQHSNAVGHLSLLICIASGFIFERVK